MAVMATCSTSTYSVADVASMFEDDNFPEDSVSESEEDIDLSDPDAGAITTSESEDGVSESRNDEQSEEESVDLSGETESGTSSSAEESPVPKRYVSLLLLVATRFCSLYFPLSLSPSLPCTL